MELAAVKDGPAPGSTHRGAAHPHARALLGPPRAKSNQKVQGPRALWV